MTKSLLIALFAATLAVPASTVVAAADVDQNAPVVPATQVTPTPPRPNPDAAHPAAAPTHRNIQLELVVTETKEGRSTSKSVSLLTRTGGPSSVRATAEVDIPMPKDRPYVVAAPGQQRRPVSLNLDARADWLGGDLIQVQATLDFGASVDSEATLRQSLNVYLRSGKAFMVSRAADPVTDRTVTVELTATIREP